MRPRRVAVVDSERGGQATLHAPGQLVSYPIVPIPGQDLRDYVRNLEETLIVLLRGLGVSARPQIGQARPLCGRGQDRFGRAAMPALGRQPRDVAQREHRSFPVRSDRLVR